MRCSTVEDRFADLLLEPSADKYLAARELLIQRDDYRQQGTKIAGLEGDFESGSYELVRSTADAWNAWACLCPRMHFLAGLAAEELGDSSAVEASKTRFQACLKAVAETGDGSMDAPFVVTYLTDIYDILRLLGERPIGQSTIENEDGRFDLVLVDGDDEPYWFDVSSLVPSGRSAASGPWTDDALLA